jgi:hypothetical protein
MERTRRYMYLIEMREAKEWGLKVCVAGDLSCRGIQSWCHKNCGPRFVMCHLVDANFSTKSATAMRVVSGSTLVSKTKLARWRFSASGTCLAMIESSLADDIPGRANTRARCTSASPVLTTHTASTQSVNRFSNCVFQHYKYAPTQPLSTHVRTRIRQQPPGAPTNI